MLVNWQQKALSALPLLFDDSAKTPINAASAYCTPGQSCFPNAKQLTAFNASIDFSLVSPPAPYSSCYLGPNYNEDKCKEVKDKYADPCKCLAFASNLV